MRDISGRLWGYNKEQVDQYLEDVREIQEREISLIMENIEACRQERDLLSRELDSLREERERYARTGELLKYALERVDNTVELIKKFSEEDIQRINEEYSKRIAIHDGYAADIDKEIKQTRARMDETLQRILQLSGGKEGFPGPEEAQPARKVVGTILSFDSKSEIVSAMGEDIAGKTVVGPNGVLVGRVDFPVIDQSTREICGFYLKGGRFVPAGCVMAVKKDSLVVSADWQKAGMQPAEKDSAEKLESIRALLEKHMAADGTVAPGGVPAAGTGASHEMDMNKPETGNNRQEVNQEERPSLEFTGGFWEDSFSPDFQPAYSPEGETGRPEMAGRLAGQDEAEKKDENSGELFFAGDETACTSGQAAGLLTESFYDTKENSPAADAESAAQKVPAEPRQTSLNRASPAVAREIKTVRHKYVVGKLAGEDLYDNEGQMIVRKNETITPKIIEKAEKEGKLAELIINMVIPGLEQ